MPADTPTLLRHLRRLTAAPGDARLLEQFVRRRDGEAFAALVGRHGPMVWGVCRRLLADAQAAEDCFQATFLVLARKAATVRPPEALAGWLFGVARRTALKARGRRPTPRPLLEEVIPRGSRPDVLAELTARELLAVLDDELARLPEEYRLPVVLCCLEGRSREEVARQLGWTAGSVKGRLERGRKLLHARLARRGLTLAAALAVVEVSRSAAGVPAALAAETARAALTGATSVRVAALAEGAASGIGLGRFRSALALLVLVAAGAAGAGLLVPPPPAAERPGDAQQKAVRKPVRTATDADGDPLPVGAVARLGSARLRTGNAVSALAFSPDGRSLASRSRAGTIHLWDADTGRELVRITGQQLGTTALAFSPDGKHLACAGDDGWVGLWDAATGKGTGLLLGHRGQVQALAYSPDGTMLATGGADQTVRLWDLEKGKELGRLGGHTGAVRAVAWSPDGTVLATGGMDHTVRLWDAGTKRLRRRLDGHQEAVTGLAWFPGGKRLVSGGLDGTFRTWDALTGRQVRADSSRGAIAALALSPDGKTLYGCGWRPTVFAWDAATGEEVRRMTGPENVHCLALSPDGKALAAGGTATVIGLWDPQTGRPLRTAAGHSDRVYGVAYSPDGKLLATGGDNHIGLWDAGSRREVGRLRVSGGHVGHLAFSPDSRLLASGSQGGTVRLWDLANRSEIRCHDGEGYHSLPVAFSPDGKALATSRDGLTVWDVPTGSVLRKVRIPDGGSGGSFALAYSPDGRYLVLGGGSSPVLCAAGTGKVIRPFKGHADFARGVAISADGRSLLTGSRDGTVRLWEVATGKQRRLFAGHESAVNSVAFRPGGKVIASGSGAWDDHRDNTVRLWDVATGKQRRCWAAHQEAVGAVAFSPDGKNLASASLEGSVLIWDVTEALPTRPAHRKDLTARQFDRLWGELASEDAARAFDAQEALAAAADQAAELLRRHLRPVPGPGPGHVTRLIAELRHPPFAVRDRAQRELERLGELAAPALRAEWERVGELEARRRIEVILGKLVEEDWPAERLRVLRAIEILEGIGTPSAGHVLTALAGGAPEARLTREARAALGRLAAP